METTLDIKVTPLSPACGAEIEGVDLARDLPGETIAAIKAAWAKHLVLVFRGQTITQEQQLRFAARFGELGERKVAQAREELRPLASGTQQTDPRVMLVSNIKVDGAPVGAFGDGEMWFHIDSRLFGAALQIHLPLCGRAALDRRQYAVCQHVQGVRGGAAPRSRPGSPAARRSTSTNTSAPPRSMCPTISAQSLHYFHPVFTTHPDTGRKTLFVDRLMTARIEGVGRDESDAILEQLYAHRRTAASSSTSMSGVWATW